jgi:para-aminobenzoate synthetase component 1
MGSMTGAPKISAMQIIDRLEKRRRGLYSGSVGYISPNGDCDFNVVIRSLQYSEKTKRLHLNVGGAITIASDIQREYDEVLLKAQAIRNFLAPNDPSQ